MEKADILLAYKTQRQWHAFRECTHSQSTLRYVASSLAQFETLPSANTNAGLLRVQTLLACSHFRQVQRESARWKRFRE